MTFGGLQMFLVPQHPYSIYASLDWKDTRQQSSQLSTKVLLEEISVLSQLTFSLFGCCLFLYLFLLLFGGENPKRRRKPSNHSQMKSTINLLILARDSIIRPFLNLSKKLAPSLRIKCICYSLQLFHSIFHRQLSFLFIVRYSQRRGKS